MGKVTGFKEYPRVSVAYRQAGERMGDFDEIFSQVPPSDLQTQGARCMDCGVPFCQSADGCPVDNLIPEWNDLVYRGEWRAALDRLHATNNFPEFTGRVCPAPCEGACVLGITDPAVTIKNIEQAIVDRGFAEGWISSAEPAARSGYHVAIVGSGPAGLAAADELNQAGHQVTVYERADRIGGLLMYGIPNMKLDKDVVQRRVDLLRGAGVSFITGTSVGESVTLPGGDVPGLMVEHSKKPRHLPARELLEHHDAVVLAVGATVPRDLPIPGREYQGIHFAMDYLTRSTQAFLDHTETAISAAGRQVVVIGGGDTGADCIGTALRQGCESIVNFELLAQPPAERAEDNPWPQWPLILRSDYAHTEAQHRFGDDPRTYNLLSKAFTCDDHGRVSGICTVTVDWDKPSDHAPFSEVVGSERTWPCDLVFLSMGFTGPEVTLAEELGLERDARSNLLALPPGYQCEESSVFAAGDCRRGQSLVVWAIQEGREVARSVGVYLAGLSQPKAAA
ncbi:MAG: glutamate synthase subunit beta [Arenicellales bacterium]|nr:glutamate synthase subunit beta [Arenicellales bacterium]